MKPKKIFVAALDYHKLSKLLSDERLTKKQNANNLMKLAQELYRVVKVEPEKIEPDIVTMNSVIAPIGTAILGYRKRDIIEWDVTAGKKRFLIKEIMYQPEANGEYLI